MNTNTSKVEFMSEEEREAWLQIRGALNNLQLGIERMMIARGALADKKGRGRRPKANGLEGRLAE